MSGPRFDAGHELHWEPAASNNIRADHSAAQSLFAFSPGTPGPDYLRVDYLSLVLQFDYLDLNAAAVIRLNRLDGVSATVDLLAVASSPVTSDGHLYYCVQLSQPFVITEQFFMDVYLVSLGIASSEAHATIATSSAYKLPH